MWIISLPYLIIQHFIYKIQKKMLHSCMLNFLSPNNILFKFQIG